MTERPRLQAELADLPLVDWLRHAHRRAEHGGLHVQWSNGEGRIYIERGQAVHAESPAAQGETAALALLRRTDGAVTFDPNLDTTVRSIRLPNHQLILKAMRTVDDWSWLSAVVPVDQMNLRFRRTPLASEAELSARERQILAQLGSPKSIDDLEAALGSSAIGLQRVLAPLVAAGVARLIRAQREQTAVHENGRPKLNPETAARIKSRLRRSDPEPDAVQAVS